MAETTQLLRPYYNPDTFDSGYSVIYKPGLGVVDHSGSTITSKILNNSTFETVNKLISSKSIIQDHYKKDVYSDLEFSEYFDWSNLNELLKSLINSFFKNYIRCLVSQPFEVVRLLLQSGDFTDHSGEDGFTNDGVSYDDDEEIEYFQPIKEEKRTRVVRTTSTKDKQIQKTSKKVSAYIKPMSLNTIDMMSSVLSFEGGRGLWRATNATFMINVLNSTIEAWFTGFLSPFFQIPDPFFVDVTHSPEPLTTLLISVFATVFAGLILAPLDLIRTKLIITKIDAKNERSIRNTIRNLKFFTCPVSLIVPTVLNSLFSKLSKKLTPFLLFIKFGIDSTNSPIIYHSFTLLSSLLEITIKLPIETLLRRAQISYLLRTTNNFHVNPNQMLIRFAGYKGLLMTPYDIVHSGQSLLHGWRVGCLKVLSSWGLKILENNYDDQFYKEEKF